MKIPGMLVSKFELPPKETNLGTAQALFDLTESPKNGALKKRSPRLML